MADFAEKLRQGQQEPRQRDFASALKQNRTQSQEPEQDPALAFARSVTGQEELTGPGLGFSERFQLGLAGDTPEEQRAAFEEKYPQGEFVPIRGTDKTLIRRSRDEPFEVADPSVSQALGEGRITMETLRDVGDIAGDLPELAGEAAAFAIGRGATGVLGRLGRAFAGGMGGSQAQQAGQSIAGTQRESTQEQLQRSAGEGTLSLVGGTVGEAAGRAFGAVTGRQGILSRSPEGERAIRANQRLGGEPLQPQQVTSSPLMRLAARQSQATVGAIGQALRKQNEKLTQTLRSAAPPSQRVSVIQESERALRNQNDRLLREVNKSLNKPNLSYERAAQSAQPAIQEWWQSTSKNQVDELYNAARSIEEPQFDISGLKQTARQILDQPTARREGAETTISQEGVISFGDPGGEVAAREIPSQLRQTAQKILSLDETQNIDLEFLRGLREDLFDQTLPGPSGERRAVLAAKQLRNSVTNTVRNPQNQDENFVQAWKSADEAARNRFNTRELLAVSELINTDRPIRAVQSVARPGSGEALQELQRALPTEDFNRLREAFKTDLLNNSENLTTRLGRFDQFTKRQLLTEPEEKALMNYGQSIDNLEATGVRRALQAQEDSRSFIDDLVATNNSRDVGRLRSLINEEGGKDSSFGKSIRAAVIDNIFREVRRSPQGVEKLDSAALQNILGKYRQTGVLSLMNNDEKRLLSNIRTVQDVVDTTSADAGTSIQAAETASGLLEGSKAAIGELTEKFGVGRVLTNRIGRRLLVGEGKGRPVNLNRLSQISAMAGTISRDVEATDSEEVGRKIEGLRAPQQPAGQQEARNRTR